MKRMLYGVLRKSLGCEIGWLLTNVEELFTAGNWSSLFLSQLRLKKAKLAQTITILEAKVQGHSNNPNQLTYNQSMAACHNLTEVRVYKIYLVASKMNRKRACSI